MTHTLSSAAFHLAESPMAICRLSGTLCMLEANQAFHTWLAEVSGESTGAAWLIAQLSAITSAVEQATSQQGATIWLGDTSPCIVKPIPSHVDDVLCLLEVQSQRHTAPYKTILDKLPFGIAVNQIHTAKPFTLAQPFTKYTVGHRKS